MARSAVSLVGEGWRSATCRKSHDTIERQSPDTSRNPNSAGEAGTIGGRADSSIESRPGSFLSFNALELSEGTGVQPHGQHCLTDFSFHFFRPDLQFPSRSFARTWEALLSELGGGDWSAASVQSAATSQRSSVVVGVEAGVIRRVKVGKREGLDQGAVLAAADAMSSVAARSFGVSASVIRPTSPYLNVPPLAHSTTSPMPCFLVVATRRAAVRNSFRS